jgi:hypothetical protein
MYGGMQQGQDLQLYTLVAKLFVNYETNDLFVDTPPPLQSLCHTIYGHAIVSAARVQCRAQLPKSETESQTT